MQNRTEINGYTARAFLHEYDHLEGITFTQRVSKLKLDRAKKQKIKLDRIRKKNEQDAIAYGIARIG